MLGADAKSRLLHWLLILGILVPALACTLPTMQFTDSMESFNVLTAVEIVRDGHWAVPTLWGRPRLEKPPLAHWLTALGILTGGRLEFSARFITVMLSCLTLVVAYEWGRLLCGARTALIAVAIAGTNIAFLRFSRRAGYDSHLMFWVTLTNYALTWFVMRGRMRPAVLVGGLALGGALMSKGPPALLHTLVPVGAFAVWVSLQTRQVALLRKTALVLLLVLTIGVAVTIPWVVAVVRQSDLQVARLWLGQVMLEPEAIEGLYTPPLQGFVFLGMLAPWTLWYLMAFAECWRTRKSAGRQLGFLLTLSLLPVVIHAFIPPMRDRYLLPMMVPAAIACAIVVAGWLERSRAGQLTLGDKIAYIVHLTLTFGLVAGYPLFFGFTAEDHMHLGVALALASVGAAALAVAVALRRRFPAALIVATVVCMLQYQMVYAWHQNREPRAVETAGRQVAADGGIARMAAYVDNTPPRAFALYADKPLVLVSNASAVPAGSVLVTEKPGPEGWVWVLEFREGRHLWTIWQRPAAK